MCNGYIYLAVPNGFCAGVIRAIQTVERTLEKYGSPVFVKHEIIHNKYVINELSQKGVVFIENLKDHIKGRPLIISAHGVPKETIINIEKKNIHYIDATCPLVSKVHKEIKRLEKQNSKIIFIGKANHIEAIGTIGQVDSEISIVSSVEDVEKLPPYNDNISYITQTTLSIIETKEIIEALRNKFPRIIGPKKEDICYATTNRQNALIKVINEVDPDLIIIIGDQTSSNSKSLLKIAMDLSKSSAQLVMYPEEIEFTDLYEYKRVCITAGASAPEVLIENVVNFIEKKFSLKKEIKNYYLEEFIFPLPKI